MKDIKITDSIVYIGVDDKDIDLFEEIARLMGANLDEKGIQVSIDLKETLLIASVTQE